MITIDILKREVICIMIDKMKSRISLKAFADVANVSRATVYRLIDQDDIDVVKDKNQYQLKYLDALRIKTRQLGLNPLTMEHVANLGYVYHDLSMDVNDKSDFILEGWRHVLRVYISQPDEALFEVKRYVLKSFVVAVKDMLQTKGTFKSIENENINLISDEKLANAILGLDKNKYIHSFDLHNIKFLTIYNLIDISLRSNKLDNDLLDMNVMPLIDLILLLLSEQFIGLQKNILSHKLRLLNVTKVTMQLYIDMKRGN